MDPNSNDSNNPNHPYHIHSQWNPFSIPRSGTLNAPIFSQPIGDDYNDYLAWRQRQHTPSELPSVGDEVAPSEVPSSSNKKTKKTKKGKETGDVSSPPKKKTYPVVHNWTPADELLLAKSWIAASEDSNRGNAQTGASFWFLVMDEYNGRNPPHKRTKDALSSKWTKLNAECNKYNGVVSRLSRDRRSGTNDMDFRTRCDIQYQEENLRAFNSYPAWEFLQDKQKWKTPDPVVVGRRNRRRETINVDDFDLEQDMPPPEGNASLFGPSPTPRPPGKSRKSQKSSSNSTASASTRESFEDACGKFANVSAQRNDYYNAKKIAAFVDVLRTKTDDLDPFDRQMIEDEKMAIRAQLAELRAQRQRAGGSGSGAGGSGSGAAGTEDEDEDED